MYNARTRWFDVDKHLPGILKIERASFDHPWTADEFKIYKHSRSTSSVIAVLSDEVIGYLFYETYKKHLQIINLAVAPKYRHKRIGSGLLLKAISRLSAEKRTMLITQIRESNLAAQLFFRASGFISSKIIGHCFDGVDESAYEMVFRHGWPVEIQSDLS